jgi:hypothetical protein
MPSSVLHGIATFPELHGVTEAHDAARTALNKTRPQPGDGVSAFLCNFLDGHGGVKTVKVLKKAGLRHETQADWHNCDEVHALYMATWPLSSCPKHFTLIVRLPLPTLLLTSNSLSLILTLTLVRPESFLCLLLGAYRDCFHVFLSLCVFLGFTRGGLVTHNLSSLPGLAFFFCNQLAYGRLVIRRAVEMATLGS